MKVTDVRINKYEKGSTKGFATITLDSAFVVSGLVIVEGKNGLFVSMPNTLGKDGKYHDSCFPLSKELREHIGQEVLNAFNKS